MLFDKNIYNIYYIRNIFVLLSTEFFCFKSVIYSYVYTEHDAAAQHYIQQQRDTSMSDIQL